MVDPQLANAAQAVLARLKECGATLVTAESCTGGLVAAALTTPAGASAVFLGGAVTYSNTLKTQLLGVAEPLLVEHGAVSEPVARAMAAGARERLGAHYAVALTGVAGPGGGTEAKPVGLVHYAAATPRGCVAAHKVFTGDRTAIRAASAAAALRLLEEHIA